MPDGFAQYITYQHNVQRYFREHSEKYSGVIIPLSIAATFPTGTYGFIRALCSKYHHSYAIDPRTALFQRNWDRSHVRPPHRTMAEILGGPFATVGLTERLEPSALEADDSLREVCQNCVSFQKSFRTRAEDVRKLKKYKKLLGISELDELSQPQFLIPPYFLFQGTDDPWYGLNLRSIEYAMEEADGLPVEPVMHTRDWHDPGAWASILRDLGSLDVEALWLYTNSFKEHDAGCEELGRSRIVVEETSKKDMAPKVLFGGYLSVLMAYCGLKAFGNGIGYGEWRDSGYHRGGTAMTRIYVPKVHRYLDAPAAQNLIEADPDYFASDTDLLGDCVESGRQLTDVTLVEALDHFMECRYAEIQFVTRHAASEAIAELEETCQHLTQVGPLESTKYGTSLARWADTLRNAQPA